MTVEELIEYFNFAYELLDPSGSDYEQGLKDAFLIAKLCLEQSMYGYDTGRNMPTKTKWIIKHGACGAYLECPFCHETFGATLAVGYENCCPNCNADMWGRKKIKTVYKKDGDSVQLYDIVDDIDERAEDKRGEE